MIPPAFQPAEFIVPDPADSHLGQNPLFFCLYVCRTPHTQWRCIKRLLLLARWDEEVLGNLLLEVIVFCSSITFFHITEALKL